MIQQQVEKTSKSYLWDHICIKSTFQNKLYTVTMRSSMHLVLAFVLLALIVQQSLQCTCDWRWRQVDGENVPNTLCYEDGECKLFRKQ